jgi:uncharacterized protein
MTTMPISRAPDRNLTVPPMVVSGTSPGQRPPSHQRRLLSVGDAGSYTNGLASCLAFVAADLCDHPDYHFDIDIATVKYLLLIGIALLVFWYLTRKIASDQRTKKDPAKDAPAGQLPPQSGNEAMVRCAHCGVFLPVTEAVREGESAYCSEQHRQLAKPSES